MNEVVEHILADLPKEPIDGSHAFEVTGINFCGPFLYKSEVRSRSPVKCYVCIFICIPTKAIHLELIKDLSTVSFLHGRKRFICTRRRPRQIWSDNATNFVGAPIPQQWSSEKYIGLLPSGGYWLVFHSSYVVTLWGLWEMAVKIAEHHFYRAVGTAVLSFEEFRTLDR